MKTLRFEIDTDASYSPEELEELQNNFVDWITDLDGDADGATADVRIARPLTDERKREIAAEFLQDAKIQFQVQARIHPDSGEIDLGRGSAFLDS